MTGREQTACAVCGGFTGYCLPNCPKGREQRCESRSNGFHCGLVEGHDGDHVDGQAPVAWPGREQTRCERCKEVTDGLGLCWACSHRDEGRERACDYAGCRDAAVGSLPGGLGRYGRPTWYFCSEHAKQKHHPRDIDLTRFVPATAREQT